VSTAIRPDDATAHRKRLAAWRQRHPGSAHAWLDLDELEALKSENDRLAAQDRRERPDVCASYPSFLTIGNTHKCNLTCQMCFKQLDDADNMSLPDMGLGRFERVAHELFPHLRTVALSVTGEPLVSPTILDELDLIATYGVRAQITSNGMPLSRSGLIERMMPATDVLTISMDGARAPTFEAIRRQAKFDRVVANIRRFNAARDALPADAFRPRLNFSHILQYRNVTELPQLVELASQLGVDHVHVDHVYVHTQLNAGDSLLRHRRLTNEMLERARATAARLHVDLRLPQPFDVAGAEPDAPYQPLADDVLREQARVRLDTVPFDPRVHERWDLDAQYQTLDEVRRAGGGNEQYVERLLERKALLGHLRWGLPQLGDSLIPPASEKVSACLYAWRESYVGYDGLVHPCCNASMGVARIIGHIDDAPTFREIWNGEVYQRLRRSLSSGRNYKFCRTCYLYEPVDEAAWGTNETWFKVAAVLDGDGPVVAGHVPAGRRIVLTEVRSGAAAQGARLRILLGGSTVAELVAARRGNGSADAPWCFDRELGQLALADEAAVSVQCAGARGLRVELLGFQV
jgi:MoaA/NifB/PqqE/SkfB family radical SAM enzyme